MTDSPSISFGDRVRVRATPATEAAGLLGLVGDVYGETTPSVTGVQIVPRPVSRLLRHRHSGAEQTRSRTT